MTTQYEAKRGNDIHRKLESQTNIDSPDLKCNVCRSIINRNPPPTATKPGRASTHYDSDVTKHTAVHVSVKTYIQYACMHKAGMRVRSQDHDPGIVIKSVSSFHLPSALRLVA